MSNENRWFSSDISCLKLHGVVYWLISHIALRYVDLMNVWLAFFMCLILKISIFFDAVVAHSMILFMLKCLYSLRHKINLLWSFIVFLSDRFLDSQVTTAKMLEHISDLLLIPGSKLLFGGEPLTGHSIPKIYGAMKPTALFVPIEEILKENNFELVTKEIFGPFQVKTCLTRTCFLLYIIYWEINFHFLK